MANPDFKKIVIKDAHLQWPKLDQTYRYNNVEKKSEPCAQNAQGASWQCGVLMSAEEAKSLWGELQAHYKDCQTRNSKLPNFSTVFGMKKREDGLVVFNAKKNGTNRAGQNNEPPKLLAGDLSPLEDRRIWGGSIGNMRVLAYPTQSPQGDGGISLLLDTIQVTKAVYGSDADGDDFAPVTMQTEKVETEAEQETDVFGLPPIEEQQSSATANDLDDEIPF